MARRTPTTDTVRQLYARSGNICAFPDCEHPIFNDKGTLVAQICHITAANKGGQRYNPEQTDEDRRAYDNLLLMCHRHHKETDIEEEFSVEALRDIKATHEAKFNEEGRQASENMIRQIKYEIDYYWNKLSNKKFDLENLKIERDFEKDLFGLFEELEDHISTVSNYCDICAESDSSKNIRVELEELFKKLNLDIERINEVPHEEHPFLGRNWELHNIGRPNYFSHISLCLDQIKLKTTEELLRKDPENEDLKLLLEKFQEEFDQNYSNSYHVD